MIVDFCTQSGAGGCTLCEMGATCVPRPQTSPLPPRAERPGCPQSTVGRAQRMFPTAWCVDWAAAKVAWVFRPQAVMCCVKGAPSMGTSTFLGDTPAQSRSWHDSAPERQNEWQRSSSGCQTQNPH